MLICCTPGCGSRPSQSKNVWRLKTSQVMAAIPLSLVLHYQILKNIITRDTTTTLTMSLFRRLLVSPTDIRANCKFLVVMNGPAKLTKVCILSLNTNGKTFGCETPLCYFDVTSFPFCIFCLITGKFE